MRTALGRFLATHTEFFARLWMRNMESALDKEAMDELAYARAEVVLRADMFVYAAGDESVGAGERLTSAVCRLRNAQARVARAAEERNAR
jgi:hypothetical protein